MGENLESHAINDDNELSFIDWGDDNANLPPIPEDEEFENDRIVRTDFFEEQGENSDGADATEELAEAASSSEDRRGSGTVIPPERILRLARNLMMRLSRRARKDLLFRTPCVNPQPD